MMKSESPKSSNMAGSTAASKRKYKNNKKKEAATTQQGVVQEDGPSGATNNVSRGSNQVDPERGDLSLDLREEEGSPSSRPVDSVMPGAYHVQGIGGSSSTNRDVEDHDVVDGVVPDSGRDAQEQQEQQEQLPVAQPVSAELVRDDNDDTDGWWHKKRNQWLLGGIIVVLVGLVVGLAIGLTNANNRVKDEKTTAESPPPDTPTESPPPDMPTMQPTTCQEFDIIENQDLLGSNLFGYQLPTILPYIRINVADFDNAIDECQSICATMPKCRSFSIIEKGAHPNDFINNGSPWCFPKDGIPKENEVLGITSGVRNMDCINDVVPEEVNFDMLNSTNLVGMDISCVTLPHIDTLESMTSLCRDVCSVMSECRYFTAVDPSIGPNFNDYTCCLKNGIPGYEEGQSMHTNSGIKKRE